MVEAVAEGGCAGLHARNLEFDELVAKQGHDILQRADPAQALGRGGSLAPAHRLGPGEDADDGRNRLREKLGGGAAGPVDGGEPNAVALDEPILAESGLAQKAFERLWRRPR